MLPNSNLNFEPCSKCTCFHQRWHCFKLLFRFHVDGQKWLKNATCGRGLLRKRKKKSPFSHKNGYVLTGVKCQRSFEAVWSFFSTNQLMRKYWLLTGSQIKKNLNRCPNTPSTQSCYQLQMGVWFKALLISVLFLEYLGKISFNRKMTQILIGILGSIIWRSFAWYFSKVLIV